MIFLDNIFIHFYYNAELDHIKVYKIPGEIFDTSDLIFSYP